MTDQPRLHPAVAAAIEFHVDEKRRLDQTLGIVDTTRAYLDGIARVVDHLRDLDERQAFTTFDSVAAEHRAATLNARTTDELTASELRRQAAVAITEADERGDLDMDTVTWLATRLLHRATHVAERTR